MKSAFEILKGWVSKFEINGVSVAGESNLYNDVRLLWHLEKIGGAKGKTVLELGALEGAHTKTLEEAGATVTAIEGNENNFLKCLIVKNEFNLKTKFIYADFCEYVVNYEGPKFDFVSAAGVLYHQENPADLIYNLARITDTVIVWTQVASDNHPHGTDQTIKSNGKIYGGKINDYGNAKEELDSYCGGLNASGFWMFPGEMRRCFNDAGFTLTETHSPSNINGDCLLFVANKIKHESLYFEERLPKRNGWD